MLELEGKGQCPGYILGNMSSQVPNASLCSCRGCFILNIHLKNTCLGELYKPQFYYVLL